MEFILVQEFGVTAEIADFHKGPVTVMGPGERAELRHASGNHLPADAVRRSGRRPIHSGFQATVACCGLRAAENGQSPVVQIFQRDVGHLITPALPRLETLYGLGFASIWWRMWSRRPGDSTLVRLSCLDDDAQGHLLEVLWEQEVDARCIC